MTLLEAFAQYFQGVVPKGYQPTAVGKGPLQYIGTGPFKVKSFSPGRESVHVKNENYWISGQPYFDQVRIINFPSDAAKVNALLSGQIDAMADVPFAQVRVVRGRGKKILVSPTGAWTPLCMRVDVAPFTDVRVRRAFRLLINRPQVVQQGLSGYGFVGNDIYSPFDPAYAGDEFRSGATTRAGPVAPPPGRPLERARRSSSSRAGRIRAWSRGRDDLRADREPRRRRHIRTVRNRGGHDLRRPVPQVAVLGGTTGERATTCAGGHGQYSRPRRSNETNWDAYSATADSSGSIARRWDRSTRRSGPRSSRICRRMEYNDGGLISIGASRA